METRARYIGWGLLTAFFAARSAVLGGANRLVRATIDTTGEIVARSAAASATLASSDLDFCTARATSYHMKN
jgi:hypothetical protein